MTATEQLIGLLNLPIAVRFRDRAEATHVGEVPGTPLQGRLTAAKTAATHRGAIGEEVGPGQFAAGKPFEKTILQSKNF